jgi:hypothetical protein
MRAKDFLVEYDRSRTLATLTDRDIYRRLSTLDWRTLYAHWEGRDISGQLGSQPYEEFKKYCGKAVGSAIKLDMTKDNFGEEGAVNFAQPDPEYAYYWKWTKEFLMDLCEQADPTSQEEVRPADSALVV